MNPLISVIIPVYNAEAYLRECLESVVNQTWKNLQILCVDDASKDHSLDILREYARRDSRITAFSKENEHVSKARNYALAHVQGEYVLFLDSDDWLDPDTVETAVRTACEQDADVVMWSYVRELGTKSRKKHIYDGDMVFDEEKVKTCLYRRMIGPFGEEIVNPENMDALCPACVKLYRTKLLRDHSIEFYDIRQIGTYEDGLFNLDVFSYARKAVFLERYFYHYRRDNTDSVTSVFKAKLPDQWDKLYELMREHIVENNLDDTFQTALSNRIALSIVSLCINEMESPCGARSKIRRIQQLLNKPHYRMALKQLDLKPLPIHWKVFFLSAKIHCALGLFLLLQAIQKIRGK